MADRHGHYKLLASFCSIFFSFIELATHLHLFCLLTYAPAQTVHYLSACTQQLSGLCKWMLQVAGYETKFNLSYCSRPFISSIIHTRYSWQHNMISAIHSKKDNYTGENGGENKAKNCTVWKDYHYTITQYITLTAVDHSLVSSYWVQSHLVIKGVVSIHWWN